MMRPQALLMTVLFAASAHAAPKPAPKSPPASMPPAAPIVKRPPPGPGAPEFIDIAGGEFHFGCEKVDPNCNKVEKPGRKVKVIPFKMMRTEVTLTQYAVCVAKGPCTKPDSTVNAHCNWDVPGKQQDPINCVDQHQARVFCEWIGGRLPTVEEWEFAAKNGDHSIFPWGDTGPDETNARWGRDDGTSPVGTHPAGATALGLEDMAGNVWEWTESNFDKKLVAVRGGAWGNVDPKLLRNSNVGRAPPEQRVDWIGFRCAQ